MDFEHINEFFLLGTHLLDAQTPEDFKRRLDHLVHNTEIPITLAYGSEEPVISKYCIDQMYERLGIAQQDIVHIDPESDPVDVIMKPSGRRITGYMIKGGGHFAHAKFSQYSNRMVDNLLNYSVSK